MSAAARVPAAFAAFHCRLGIGGATGALVDLAVGALVFGLLGVAGVRLAGDAPMRETLLETWRSLARRGRTA